MFLELRSKIVPAFNSLCIETPRPPCLSRPSPPLSILFALRPRWGKLPLFSTSNLSILFALRLAKVIVIALPAKALSILFALRLQGLRALCRPIRSLSILFALRLFNLFKDIFPEENFQSSLHWDKW